LKVKLLLTLLHFDAYVNNKVYMYVYVINVSVVSTDKTPVVQY